ncbi:MAG: acetylornithine/succinylornithine family transaminase [Gammaproteobacteria bacterium]
MPDHIMPTYQRLPVTFTRGQGAWLWDQNDRRYLDALSGIAVCNLGHAHSAVHRAICNQSEKLLHTSNLYGIENQDILADKLAALSGMDNVFFCNSGAEANEAAIKLARLYGRSRQVDNPAILVMEKSFHGRTMATLSATGNTKVQQGFEPLLEGFVRVPYNNAEAVEKAVNRDSNIVAILVEPVQGEGGVNIPAGDYLNKLRELCDRKGLLLMLDEIQTGIARTGKMFAFQHNRILPDVCTLAKALGNGVPIGACMARGEAAKIMTAGKHGSTFGGNPLACSAALAVLDTIENGNIAQEAELKGRKIASALSEKLASNAKIAQIRNLGMMIGIELTVDCSPLVGLALDQGLLINVTAEKTIRLLPPLIIEDEQIEFLIETLSGLIQRFTLTTRESS